MEFSVDKQTQAVTITLDCCFDVSSYEYFKSLITENLTDNNLFVVDFKATEFLDSSALGMLLLLREKTHGDKSRIKLVNVGDAAQKILNVAQFQQLFNIKYI